MRHLRTRLVRCDKVGTQLAVLKHESKFSKPAARAYRVQERLCSEKPLELENILRRTNTQDNFTRSCQFQFSVGGLSSLWAPVCCDLFERHRSCSEEVGGRRKNEGTTGNKKRAAPVFQYNTSPLYEKNPQSRVQLLARLECVLLGKHRAARHSYS
jgi:hypothetical protein